MITNESVQRLIACDRDVLIALMGLSMAIGRAGGERDFDSELDPDIRALLICAWGQNAPPSQMQFYNGKWFKRGDPLRGAS